MDPLALVCLNKTPTQPSPGRQTTNSLNSLKRNQLINSLLPNKNEVKKRKVAYEDFILNNLVNAILVADEIIQQQHLKPLSIRDIASKLDQKGICHIPRRTLSCHVAAVRKEKAVYPDPCSCPYSYDSSKLLKSGRPPTLNDEETERFQVEIEKIRALKNSVTKFNIQRTAREVVKQKRETDTSEWEGLRRATRVGGKKWMRRYMKVICRKFGSF